MVENYLQTRLNPKLVFCFFILFIILGISLPAYNQPMILLGINLIATNIIPLVVIVLCCFFATFYGWVLLRLLGIHETDKLELIIYSMGTGLGLLSFTIFGLGVVGILIPGSLLIILMFSFTSGFTWTGIQPLRLAKPLSSKPLGQENTAPYVESLIYKLILAMAILAGLYLFFFSLLPPVGYDALEYHFGSPSYYLNKQLITYISGNCYANFPQLTEMLIYGGMTCEGVISGKLFLFVYMILGGLALHKLGNRYHSKMAGIVAAAMFWALPICGKLLLQGNIDHIVAVYGLLSLGLILKYQDTTNQRGFLILAGLMAGFALSTKYIALVTVCIPLSLFVVFSSTCWTEGLKRVFLFLCIAFIPLFPWLIKNYIFTGNPVAPLLYSILNNVGWDPYVAEKFKQAHAFNFSLSYLINNIKGMTKEFHFIGTAASYALIPTLLIPLSLFPNPMKEKVTPLWFISLFGFIGWLFTNQVDRFLIPVMAIICLIISVSFIDGFLSITRKDSERSWHSIAGVLMIILIGCNLFNLGNLNYALYSEINRMSHLYQNKTNYIAGLNSPLQINFLAQNLSTLPVIETVNHHLGPNERILAIAEARRTYFSRDIEMNTVFDVDYFEALAKTSSNPKQMADELIKNNITYIFYNPHELKRLESFYGPYYNPANPQFVVDRMNQFFTQQTELLLDYKGYRLYKIKQ